MTGAASYIPAKWACLRSFHLRRGAGCRLHKERDALRQLLTLLVSLDSHVARFDGRWMLHGR